MVDIYGIPNCDTVKKALDWMRANKVDFQFHDLKKEGAPLKMLKEWAKQCSWEALINRKSSTFRKLDEERKDKITTEVAGLKLMEEYTSLIKRPVIFRKGTFLINGFDATAYEVHFL